jgi:NADH:ubiquinone oxidoreductase subunit 5 (subunit L)/multisubunit Na+/H+ antiporter MnhA subunit
VELGGSSQAVFRNVCWLLAVLGIGLTAYYSSRLFRLVFSNTPKSASLNSQHEIPNLLIICLIVLGTVSVIAGWLLSDLFTIGIQRNGDSLLPYQHLIIKVELEIDPYTLSLPLLFNGIGIAAGVNTVLFINPEKRHTFGFNLLTMSQTLGG